MGATVVGSTGDAAGFPLRLSLAVVLPLRLADVKDSVPCLKLAELFKPCALAELDLWGAMTVVVEVERVMLDFRRPDSLQDDLM
jgi:hypothetical protein